MPTLDPNQPLRELRDLGDGTRWHLMPDYRLVLVPAPAAPVEIYPFEPIPGMKLFRLENADGDGKVHRVELDGETIGWLASGDDWAEIQQLPSLKPGQWVIPNRQPISSLEFDTLICEAKTVRAAKAKEVPPQDWANPVTLRGRKCKAWNTSSDTASWGCWVEFGDNSYWVTGDSVSYAATVGELLPNRWHIPAGRLADLDRLIDEDEAKAAPKPLTAEELVPFIGRVLVRDADRPHCVGMLTSVLKDGMSVAGIGSLSPTCRYQFAPLGTRHNDESAWKDRPYEAGERTVK